MKQTLDNYEEFIEKTILNPIIFDKLCVDPDFMNLRFGPIDSGNIREAIWEAFKAGRKYQFEIQNNK